MVMNRTEIGARRWKDLRVGEWLGYKRPRSIRALIHKRLAELERHGIVETAPEYPGIFGYWLNFHQVIALCAWVDTPRGKEVWDLIVKINAAVWSHNQHSVTGVLALREELISVLDGLLRLDFRDHLRHALCTVQ
jgi:hypothetical protein